ncbi:hypothetical protein EZV73_11115 [Acidaminobacter sp. JC074]|uniref:hypothetical protein n=1 Tax=Acidaminobacter sp. JC074 TaxID=2530199 RepID=UPI001F0D05FD|nr:hypothetical protein [Acidaminobacter sp. JC074]MCH4888126.1 hypothetical protein [Acidaminobacter sp. JC074]
MGQFFDQFDEIYTNREQYNLSWAFKDAQDKLDDYKKDVVDTKIKKECIFSKTLNKEYERFRYKNHSEIRKQKMISSIFMNTHGLLNVLEILLSVILVILISNVSHSEMLGHGTELFSALVVIVFAFIKVFLEQLVLKPRMEALGWQMYKRSVDVLKSLSEDINEQIGYVEAV